MQVCFAGAIMGGREDLSIYKHMVARLQAAGHEVPSSHVADLAVLSRESALTPFEVYQRDVAWIEPSDAMVAKVSIPSLGVGHEVGHGMERGLRALCLYRRGLSIFKMITGNHAPTLIVATYADLADLDVRLDAFLTSVVAGNIHVELDLSV